VVETFFVRMGEYNGYFHFDGVSLTFLLFLPV
jgi:hypothetical protein